MDYEEVGLNQEIKKVPISGIDSIRITSTSLEDNLPECLPKKIRPR